MAIDPVCGMTVMENQAAATAVCQGSPYYFCAISCKERFEKNPSMFLPKK